MYVSRAKWSNPGKGVGPSSTLRCCSYWKGSLLVALNHGRQLYLFTYRISTLVGLIHAKISWTVMSPIIYSAQRYLHNHFKEVNTSSSQTDLFKLLMRPLQVLPLWVLMDQGVRTIKKYLIFTKVPKQEPHHQIQFSIIHRISYSGGVKALSRERSQCILEPANRAEYFLFCNECTENNTLT